MHNESDFDRKGCIFVTWLIVIVLVGQEICYLVKGEWVLAVVVPLSLPLLILIPWGIMQLLIGKDTKITDDKKSIKEDGQ